jgi:SAM-dependent methyltransferase
MPNKLEKDFLQWDVRNWAKALHFWEQEVNWEQVTNCLELGAREGGLSLWLALKNKNVLCSDLENSKQTAEILHNQHPIQNQIRYEDLNASFIPYENEFDLIVFKSILGGIGRGDDKQVQADVFHQAFKALKPGGKLIFAENLEASPLHRFFRKRFAPWSNYWRYISESECREFTNQFCNVKLEVTGFAGAFGRTEIQRNILALTDQCFFNFVLPRRWKYIVYVIAEKPQV